MHSGVFAHLADDSGNSPNLLSDHPNPGGSCDVKAGILPLEVPGTRMCITVKNGRMPLSQYFQPVLTSLRRNEDERDYRSHGLRQLWGVLEYLPGAV